MSEKTLRNHIAKLKALEAEKKELEKQISKLQEGIKQEMRNRGTDEAATGDWMVRFKAVVSNKFQTKEFAAAHPRLYKKYIAPAESMRFTVSELVQS